jgi:hypothetical protein
LGYGQQVLGYLAPVLLFLLFLVLPKIPQVGSNDSGINFLDNRAVHIPVFEYLHTGYPTSD